MYPVNVPWWLSLIWVIIAIVAAFWVAKKDQSARPIGLLAAAAISFITAWTWFTWLSVLWAVLVVLVTAALFLVGMFVSDDKDNLWHYLALTTALLGKVIIAGFAAAWDKQVPLLVALVLALLVVGLVAAVIRLTRSPRVKQAMNKEEEVAPAATPSS